MSSGLKTEVINTRERALSTDINRLQAFAGAELCQILYEQFGKYFAQDDVTPGNEAEVPAGGTLPFNMVVNGLRPYPVNGTVNMLVTPGVTVIENTTAGADDAKYLYCNDPGVTAVGTLVLTPGGGVTRIDILEWQPTSTVIETDNRDIFNTGTGLFAPAAVTKVVAARLTYRIRTGVVGAGMPALAAGWIPALVIRVPAGAVNWDTCDMWDVRNLVSELWNAPYLTSRYDSVVDKCHVVAEETAGAGTYDILLTGNVDGKVGISRFGGKLSNNPAGTAYIDITKTTANQAAGFTPIANAPWYVYLAFPFGLFGWRKYCSSATSPRVPTGARGIPVVAVTSPWGDRRPVGPIALPLSTGLGGSTSAAYLIGAGYCDSAAKPRGFECDGERTRFSSTASMSNLTPFFSDPITTKHSDYNLVEGIAIPACTKSVSVKFALEMDVGAPVANDTPVVVNPMIYVYDSTFTRVITRVYVGPQPAIIYSGKVAAIWEFEVEIPNLPKATPGSLNFSVIWTQSAFGPTFMSAPVDEAHIVGWKLDP